MAVVEAEPGGKKEKARRGAKKGKTAAAVPAGAEAVGLAAGHAAAVLTGASVAALLQSERGIADAREIVGLGITIGAGLAAGDGGCSSSRTMWLCADVCTDALHLCCPWFQVTAGSEACDPIFCHDMVLACNA